MLKIHSRRVSIKLDIILFCGLVNVSKINSIHTLTVGRLEMEQVPTTERQHQKWQIQIYSSLGSTPEKQERITLTFQSHSSAGFIPECGVPGLPRIKNYWNMKSDLDTTK